MQAGAIMPHTTEGRLIGETHLIKFDVPAVRPLDLAGNANKALLEIVLGRCEDHLRLDLGDIRAPTVHQAVTNTQTRACLGTSFVFDFALPSQDKRTQASIRNDSLRTSPRRQNNHEIIVSYPVLAIVLHFHAVPTFLHFRLVFLQPQTY